MNKKEMARLIKSQSEAIKALSEKHQTLENALNTILAKNPHLAGETKVFHLGEPVTIDKPMLSGNERIERLLKKQSLVIVKCSDHSYEDAKRSDFFWVCTGIVDDIVYNYRVSTANEEFKFGIPFDEHGNEITEV